MADVVVLTANYGHFDLLRPQVPQDIPVEWVVFTDDPDLVAPEPWLVVQDENHGAEPCMAAKRFKLLPPVHHRFALWIDANMEITSPSFAREALACIHDGIALFKHPRRDCIYDEAEASLGAESQGGKYDGLGIPEQMEGYRKEGFPEHAGLYACGTIAWDREDPHARRLGMAWMSECAHHTYQDQLSLPVVLKRLGIEPGVFPIPQITRYRPLICNPWMTIHNHL